MPFEPTKSDYLGDHEYIYHVNTIGGVNIFKPYDEIAVQLENELSEHLQKEFKDGEYASLAEINAVLRGSYIKSERKIILYFIMTQTVIDNDTDSKFLNSLKRHTVDILKLPDSDLQYAAFETRAKTTHWYIEYVLCHELAHHYTLSLNKYRKSLIDRKTDEKRTDILARRIYKEFLECLVDRD